MKIGSLFSGAGGLDLAVQAVFDGQVVWHAEVDKAASKVLAHHHPDTPNLGDVTEVNWNNWKPALKVDVLCGGYPCQPFSAAGKRKGTDDDRHLWPYFADAIRHLRPRFVVLENVAGHRSMGFDSVLADLAQARYDTQWCSVRASDVGAPHRRERLFIVASDARDGDVAEWSWSQGREEGQRSSVGCKSGCSCDAAADPSGNGCCGSAQRNLITPAGLQASQRDDIDRRVLADGGNNGRAGLNLLPTPNASDASGGGMHPDSRYNADGLRHSRQLIDDAKLSPEQFWGKYEPAIRRWESLTRPAPAPTEPNKNGNPRLSAAFSEWLMGWPAGWVTDPNIGISRNDQLKIIGNGVCPQQATQALTYLLTIQGENT